MYAKEIGSTFIFVLAFGNTRFQIVVPAPREDQHLIGYTVVLRRVPVFGWFDPSRVRGPTQFRVENLSSSGPVKGPCSIAFNFDEVQG